MKQLRFTAIFLATIFLLGCENEIDSGLEKGMGEIAVQLHADDSFHITAKADGDLVTVPTPSADAFDIEIFDINANNIIRKGTYGDLKGKAVNVNEGSFRVSAAHGNASSFGFGVEEFAYFSATEELALTPQEYKKVTLTAKMTKVMMTVSYTENVRNAQYHNFYSVIRSVADEQTMLQFDPADEAAQGFIPAGSFHYEFHVQKEDGGEERVFVVKGDDGQPLVLTYNPNQYVRFHIDIDGASFSATINTNSETVSVPLEEVVIDSEYGSKAAPRIEVEGVSTFSHVGKTDPVLPGAMTAHIVADGLIQNAVLTIHSDYLTGTLGLPSEVDLATADQATRNRLIAAGINIIPDADPMAGAKFAMVDFTGVAANYTADGLQKDFSAAFGLKITDQKQGNTPAEQAFDIKIAVFNASLTAPAPADVWAKKVYNITGTVTSGNPTRMTAQYSKDGQTWKPVVEEDLTTPLSIIGLEGNTTYRMRILHEYSGDAPIYETSANFFTTETDVNVPNAGMEEWSEWEYNANSSSKQTNYAPYLNEASRYWDTNNSETTPADQSLSSPTFKSFPMVSYVNGRNGRAAQIMAIAVNWWNTSGTSTSDAKPGELFIGTYGGTRKGTFSSRPDKLNFWFKYDIRTDDNNSSDTYRAYIALYNGSEMIGEGILEQTHSSDINDWTQATVDINYNNKSKKATAIYIQFLQSTKSKPVYNMDVSITYGGTKTANVHGGSILTIDDIELLYE